MEEMVAMNKLELLEGYPERNEKCKTELGVIWHGDIEK